MANPPTCSPRTPWEQQAYNQCRALDQMLCAGRSNSFLPYGTPQSPWGFDAFGTQLNQDFELDLPVALTLAVEHAKTRPEEAVVVVATAAGVSESPPMSAKAADALWDALFSAGNLPGNVVGSAETVLRAAFKRQAMKGFATLLAGHVGQPIRLGPHITITPHRIAQDGTLRRGAKLIVRVRGLPLNVLQGLPTPLAVNRGGTVGTARISARHLAQMQTAGHAVADARLNSMRFFRATGTRVGGGVLAFGPSAAIDFYNSARVDNGSLAVDWRGFAVKSAKSQSGNLVGVIAGGVAVAVVGTVGWPVVLLGLGVGIVAQAVWSTTGMDERAAQAADRHLPK